jgi:lipid-A-disaccharide synthase
LLERADELIVQVELDAADRHAARDVFALAGEASGDRYGAALIETLRALDPSLTFRGIGGPRMEVAGADLLFDSRDWGTIGIGEALANIPRLARMLRRTIAHRRAQPPALLVLVDFGAFNVRVARGLLGAGVRILYFIPPGCWSRTARRGDLPNLVDAIATPFSWSAERLQGGRAKVEWVGHPLLDLVRPSLSPEKAYPAYDLDPSRPVLAFVPGSRRHEINCMLPVMAEATRLVAGQAAGAQFLVAVAPTVPRETIAQAFDGVEVRLLDGMEYDAIQLAGAAAATSGTATLELALLGVPMLVAYRGSRLTELQYAMLRALRRVGPIGLPNVMAGRLIVPELLQAQATPARIATQLVAFLGNPDLCAAMRRDFAEVAQLLGSPGALERTARLALSLMRGG